MVVNNVAQALTPGKQALLFVIAASAVSMPTLMGQFKWFRDAEPAFAALLIGIFTSLIAFVLFRYAFQELTPSTLLSATVLAGLIAAHVAVFHISGRLPGVMTYMLFIFVFYWDLAEGAVETTAAANHALHHAGKIE